MNKLPSIWLTLLPIILLIILLTTNVIIFKDASIEGPNQLALLFCAAVCIGIGTFVLKIPYKLLEKSMITSISRSLQAVLILLVVGALIGTWILSGIVPTMIYYGLKVLHPSYFLPVTCIICCIVSLATGSSWSTAGTMGVALVAIGKTLGIPDGLIAGAVISGAYFGDKLSPLSDTTNLAPAAAGSDLFGHIRHMLYTTIPAITITIIIFTIIGLNYDADTINTKTISSVLQTLQDEFNIGIHLLIIPIAVIVMVVKRVPALPALCFGLLLGIVCAVIFQPQFFDSTNYLQSSYQKILEVASKGYSGSSKNAMVHGLLKRGGMYSMLNTIWIILAAMALGGALEGTKMLEKLANSLLSVAKGSKGLIASTLGSCIFLNITASEQYLAIIVPGRMFYKSYKKYNLDPRNLSRALEDSGTVTSVLVPWNSGGAYISTVLGISTLTYLPFCFFNILSPLISLLFALTGYTIIKANNSKAH